MGYLQYASDCLVLWADVLSPHYTGQVNRVIVHRYDCFTEKSSLRHTII